MTTASLRFFLTVMLLAAFALRAEETVVADDPLTAPRTQWFREARFGMFIHWGLYAVPAGYYQGKPVGGIGEWIMHKAKIPIPEYETFAAQFNPVRFNAQEWVRLAKEAGMKYLVITSKHHDGFCMFDTKLTAYNIVAATPYQKDPMKDLAAACAAEGVKFCFYHSILDWHHPDAQGARFPQYAEHLKGQIRELLTNYGPLGLLWFDGQWTKEWDAAQGRELARFARSLQPGLILNNRIGKGGPHDGDYETPEQHIPAGKLPSRLWETCMTMNDTWGYKRDDQHWKSTADLVRKLVDIASKGGNFLLNVGPTAEGSIPAPSVERLKGIGGWMKVNGAAIYGTTASPTQEYSFDGRFTRRGDVLYAHVFTWPKDGVRIAGVPGEIVSVAALDPAIKLGAHKVEGAGAQQVLLLPTPANPDPCATVLEIRLKKAP